MSINQNKILITGGAGFLGSHLTERLLREGNDVLVVDNFFTGNKQNLEHQRARCNQYAGFGEADACPNFASLYE